MAQELSESTKRKIQETKANIAAKPVRKKQPLKLAVINQNGCTGCEACIVFCPVDCIEIVPGAQHTQLQQVVEVDNDRCIGCALCAKHCPWDTIEMHSYEDGIARQPEVTLKSVCEQPTAS